MSFNRNTSQSDGDIVDKIKSVNWRGLVRQATNKVKQYAMNLSPLEVQVEEATNLDTWGPHGSVMSDIADACFDPEGYKQVLGVIARRLQEKDERWRMCYKALLLLEYLIKHGPTKVAQDVASSSSVLNRLQHFEYLDANGKDHGVNIRHRANEICELVSNPGRLKEERAKAAENKAKYTGVSASQMKSGAVGFGSTSRSGSGFQSSSISRPVAEPSTFGPSSPSFVPTSSPSQSVVNALEKMPPDENFRSSPVHATQARIASMKITERSSSYEESDEKKPTRKKLSDVKANPKIAASLGLKIVTPSKSAPPPQANQPVVVTEPSPLDLLGELENPVVNTKPQDPYIKTGSGHKAPAAQKPDIVPSSSTIKDPFEAISGTQSKPEASFDAFAMMPPVVSEPKQTEAEKKDPFADLLL